MAYKIFIDGKEGTTGLKIYERFTGRNDIEILTIDDEKRKDPIEKAKMINASDFTFLCLPDAASIESVSLCTNPKTRIIDASTAHRTNPVWAYGFPELDKSFREKIISSNRVAVPGCYASGFIAIGYPLVKSGILPKDYPVVIHAVSGYSGAGKKAIAQYEDPNRDKSLDSPRLYALTQTHKHIPEMTKITGLEFEPVFNPYVCDYFQGMTVTVGLHSRMLAKKVSAHDVWEMFASHYEGCNFVKVAPLMGEGVLPEAFIPANTLAGTNDMQVFVYGNDERIMVTTRFDNLGKGASGAAVQCLNIMMGIDETTGLR
ncbi:MAG: N-acetyl-gamma-glutamyl-phosphate reductase [Treponema sp.]|uniref:N-acetyl-gamma-glutamyl-phosphate reductase n=1 Tax=Treponema sp. TaxID=166 RepID=UPI00298E36A2|nr:N-acetyl-gamma-glutamyl-phosphate reductase [Treponema sp.]MBR5933881.1 N-acetyl-gamma-glutamyl-phosphate reductase [Treponema sp.]